MKKRILIADDHSLLRMGLKSMLRMQNDMEVVGEATNGRIAVEIATELKPDIVIMDLMMPVMNGAEATRKIREVAPKSRVIVLTSYGAAADLARAVENGASGAQSKETSIEELLSAIRTVAAGGTAFSEDLRHAIREESSYTPLTDKQAAILQSVVRGFSNKEIAKQFGISPVSVKKHLTAVFAKLGAATRAEAVGIALRRQLLKL